MNNNPVRYNDPSGHDVGCPGENASICGRRQTVKQIAKEKNIHLAPGDEWVYIESLITRQKEKPAGFNPFLDIKDGFTDDKGKELFIKDNQVVITELAFEHCKDDTDCIAGLMVHEATHSWIEGKVEQTSKTGKMQIGAQEDYLYAEELLANSVATQAFGDPTGLFESNSDFYRQACKLPGCSEPKTLLEAYYGINLDNLYDLIFGK